MQRTPFAQCKIPDFRAYIYIISVSVPRFQIFHRLIVFDALLGSFLGFAGSIFSDRVHYEPLTTLVPLMFSPHDTDIFDTVTRSFSAFKKAASKLEDYYKELPTTTLTYKEARLPYPTTFTHLQTQVKAPLKLECTATEDSPDRLVFYGWTEDQAVAVKFVRSYSKDLHKHCADLSLAPLLLGFEKLPGNWLMVVMEYMKDYKPFSIFDDPASISTQLRQIVKELVASFHAQKLVHGDIRDTNLLVRVEDGTLKTKLIDFDWGGREGEARYPVLINKSTIPRPSDVIGGQLITIDHDLKMVENIFLNSP